MKYTSIHPVCNSDPFLDSSEFFKGCQKFDPAKVLQCVNGSDNWNEIECKIFIGKIKRQDEVEMDKSHSQVV